VALTALTVAALTVGAGGPVLLGLAAVGAALYPVPTLFAMVAWATVRRRRTQPTASDAEAALLGAMSAELAAGATPRAALVAAARRGHGVDVGGAARLAGAGVEPERVSSALTEALPVHGRLAGAAWHLVATVGGPAAAMFELLAVRAADDGVLRRERRALTAQARASDAAVGGLPVLVLIGMAATGRLTPRTDPALGVVLALGVGLQAAGLAVVWAMLRRAR